MVSKSQQVPQSHICRLTLHGGENWLDADMVTLLYSDTDLSLWLSFANNVDCGLPQRDRRSPTGQVLIKLVETGQKGYQLPGSNKHH